MTTTEILCCQYGEKTRHISITVLMSPNAPSTFSETLLLEAFLIAKEKTSLRPLTQQTFPPASQDGRIPNSTLDDDERQGFYFLTSHSVQSTNSQSCCAEASSASTDSNSVTSTENPFPDREEDLNAVENAPGPDPGNSALIPYDADANAHNGGFMVLETGAVSLFLGRKRHPHEHFVFRLRGAPEDVEVDMGAVHAIVGQQTYNYMICHYFTQGSMYIVAASYYHSQNDLAAFSAALEPCGLASRVVTYLWHLISFHSNDHSDREDSRGTSDGGAEGELAAEDDAGETGVDD
ncbi:hypothetical protein M407DRAFT_23511 [Tulasnella calospora MUT 4182]|uniref:Uncharacterized protein n=1 Tax=Tulasnella calospora MUT 4182 TaxID=1051891 RepID=A0A0C3L0K7_9AGAM|nr:hypothetical protein M407DRAFT_23511 [Tulasnella calospora MUT 4182]